MLWVQSAARGYIRAEVEEEEKKKRGGEFNFKMKF